MRTLWLPFFFAFICIGVNSHLEICIPLKNGEQVSVKDIQEKVIDKIVTDFPDSITIPHLDFNIVHEAITANGTIDDLTVSNLKDFHIPFPTDFINLTFYFTNLTVVAKYDMFGNIGDLFDIWGKGDMSLHFYLALHVDMKLGKQNAFCIPLDINPEMANVTGHIDNLMDDPELGEEINGALMYLFPKVVDEFWLEFKDTYDDVIQELINCFFGYNCNTTQLTQD